jgi:predicted acylesterase/phospholipase RssA
MRVCPLLLALVLLTATGCTQRNVPLSPNHLAREHWAKNQTRASLKEASDAHADGRFVGIAISGGGSRSAVFSAACMFELQRVGLLQHVDYISSVSGGSLTAAYFCVSSDDWNPAMVEKKLTHSFASDVIINFILPWNTVALALTHWDRSDLLADSFRKTLFSRNGRELTFADLREDRPRLLINATDLQSGKPFVFCNENFDRLNSDLSRYPISHAVAASSAVPVLMNHVTLRDYSTTYKQFTHLIDGGVNDNLGISALLEIYEAHVQSARAAGGPSPYPNGAVFIVIDARTHFDARLSDKGDIGLLQTLETGAGLTSTLLLNRASSATLAEMIVRHSPDDTRVAEVREQIDHLQRTGFLRMRDRNQLPVAVMHFSLTFAQELQDVPFQGFGRSVNNVATYFNISSTEAYHLGKAAELLVQQKFEQRLLEIVQDINAAGDRHR